MLKQSRRKSQRPRRLLHHGTYLLLHFSGLEVESLTYNFVLSDDLFETFFFLTRSLGIRARLQDARERRHDECGEVGGSEWEAVGALGPTPTLRPTV